MTKEQLVQDPLVKEIAIEFAAQQQLDSQSNFENYKNSIIKKPEWEILEWSFGYNHEYKTKNPDDTVSEYNIHSVKRLSDGEIFTIGDKINIGGKNRILEGFRTSTSMKDVIWCITDNGKDMWSQISHWTKAKSPILTTEDGVDIYEGDTVYAVLKENAKCISLPLVTSKTFHSFKHLYVFFKDKEKAKEYLLMNSPCLSLNDLEGFCSHLSYTILKELVKQKLNL